MTELVNEAERTVARLEIAADARLLPPVLNFVGETVQGLGLDREVAGRLKEAVEVVCRNVIENAFAPGDDGIYDVSVLRRPGRLVVAVEDKGLPGDYDRLEGGEGSALPAMLGRSFADEVRFVNLGRGGNRVELVKELPQTDVRDHLPEEEHCASAEAPEVPEDAPVEVRMMCPEESVELARSVYRSYGYSYDWDDIYYPEVIRELQEGGLMRSCVAVSGGEIAGHLAVTVERPDSPVGESGQAVVDPRFRGHRLFEKMKAFLVEESRGRGMYGLYGEATAVHPYSQKGSLHLGARETGYLLGYIPASVSYKQIGEDRDGRRGSVALMYTRTNDEPERTVYPPSPFEDVVRRVIEHHGLRRTVADVVDAPLPASSRVNVNVRQDHNTAALRIDEPGADLRELVRLRLRELCLHRVDCVYADLPLSHPATREAGALLEELGFFFGCIVPELRGDVLRLQYLNNVEIEPGDVHTASDFGQEILSLILSQKDAQERRVV